MWNEITYPFPNFNGATVYVWEWISNVLPHITCREHHRWEGSVGFRFWRPLENPLKLSEVNLSWGDIFIIIKASTHQGANWLIGWAFA